jgi:hypothetical protein
MLIERQNGDAERTLALGFELRSKVLLGKEDLLEFKPTPCFKTQATMAETQPTSRYQLRARH